MFRDLTPTETEVLIDWIDRAERAASDYLFYDCELMMLGRIVIISKTQQNRYSQRFRFSGSGWKVTFDVPSEAMHAKLEHRPHPVHIWQGEDDGDKDDKFVRDITTWMMCRDAAD